MKESNSIDLERFIKSREVESDPVSTIYTKKNDIIVGSIKARIQSKNSKHGIDIPNTMKDCIQIDSKNNKKLWHHEVEKK